MSSRRSRSLLVGLEEFPLSYIWFTPKVWEEVGFWTQFVDTTDHPQFPFVSSELDLRCGGHYDLIFLLWHC